MSKQNRVTRYLRFWLPQARTNTLPFVQADTLEVLTQAGIATDEQGNIPVYQASLWYPLKDTTLRLRVSVGIDGLLYDLMDGSEVMGRLMLPDRITREILLLWRNIRQEQNSSDEQTPINRL